MAFPSLNAIRAFEAAARPLSFKDAAEELKLSASAVSRHIRSLERSLGVELFERGFRHVQLTEKALPYARRLSEAFRIIQDSTELVSSEGPARRRKQRRVSLSVNLSFMNFWLADRLPRFRSLYPECELEISIHDDAGKGGNPKADLRILFLPDDFDDPSVTNLISLFLFPVCAPSLVTGPNALRKPADLAKHRLLHEVNTPDWPEWIEGAGVKGIDATSGPIFHDPTLSIREALNGGGVALADSIMGEDLLARGLLVSPFPIRLQIPYCYALSQRSGAPAILSVKQFRQWLVSEIELHKRAMKLV
jgi:LysR family glycine cleavage system transcriptional activator